MSPPPSARSASLDYLKLTFAVCVVALHCDLIRDTSQIYGDILVNGIFRIAVPFFFVINGYFLPSNEDSRKAWLLRVSSLYAAWTIIYAPFWIGDYSSNAFSISSLAKFVKLIAFGYHHLWYIAGMIVGGSIIFISSKFQQKKVSVAAGAIFLIGVAIQYLGSYQLVSGRLGELFSFNWVHRNALFTAFPYMWAGFLLRRNSNLPDRGQQAPSVFSRRMLWLCATVATLLVIIESTINSFAGANTKGFDNLISIGPAAILIFALAASSSMKLKHAKSVATISTAVYLIHPIPLHLTRAYAGTSSSIELFMATLTLTLLLCAPTIALAKRFRWLL